LVANFGLTMRDRDRGKQMVEEMMMEPFLDSYPYLTGRTVEIISQGESPDFLAFIDGREMGIELTQIHAETPGDYLDEVVRLVLKKEAIYDQHGVFLRPTILACYGAGCAKTHQPCEPSQISNPVLANSFDCSRTQATIAVARFRALPDRQLLRCFRLDRSRTPHNSCRDNGAVCQADRCPSHLPR
jgi:hypothetical protein